MIEVDEAHICIACTVNQEELKSQENVSKNLATEIPRRDDEKTLKKCHLSWNQLQQNHQLIPSQCLNPEH